MSSLPLLAVQRAHYISTHGPGQAKLAMATRTLLTMLKRFFIVDKEELGSDVGKVLNETIIEQPLCAHLSLHL